MTGLADRKKIHLNQAAHNESLIEFLANTPNTDWAATATFYAALHYLQAYLLSKTPPQNPKRHGTRDAAIDNDTFLHDIRNLYRDLQDISEAARYECVQPSADELKTTVAPKLAAIKKHIKQYIS